MPVDGLTPPTRQSTVEYLADELRGAVMTGQLGQGEQLGEARLAEHFAVSRGPLREAMQRLVSEGVLLAIRNRGVFVPELSLDDVIDVYHTRTAIERGALDRVMSGDRTAACRRLGPRLTAMRSAAERGSGAAVSDADLAFHQTLVDCSGSPRLIRAMRTLVVETRMCLGELETTYGDLDTQVSEHQALRDAIEDGPPGEADRLLLAHMADAVDRLVTKRSPTAQPDGPSYIDTR